MLLPLLMALPEKVSIADNQTTANALYAAAKLGYRDRSYVTACITRLNTLGGDLSARDCSNTLWALATLEFKHGEIEQIAVAQLAE